MSIKEAVEKFTEKNFLAYLLVLGDEIYEPLHANDIPGRNFLTSSIRKKKHIAKSCCRMKIYKKKNSLTSMSTFQQAL